jgi:transposase
MAYAGIVPSEYSSGGPGKKKQGGITKTGNNHLRRLSIEAAWSYQFNPLVNLRMQKCQDETRVELIAEAVCYWASRGNILKL